MATVCNAHVFMRAWVVGRDEHFHAMHRAQSRGVTVNAYVVNYY